MIKNKTVANNISETLLSCSKEIDNSIAYVQQNCDDEEFQAYRKIMATVLGEIYLEVLRPMYKKHPDLKPDGLD